MSLDACANLVREGDPVRFATAMCAPMPARGDLMALYAFNIEVSRAPWVTQEEMIAEMRLQWWRDAIGEIFEGQAPRAHEVVGPLAQAIKKHDLPRLLFEELIEARRFDIYRAPHSSTPEFETYVAASSAHVMRLAGRILGATGDEPFSAMGYASGLANLIVALPELYARGRSPLPLSGIDRNAIIEGDVSPEMATFLVAQARVGLDMIEEAKTVSVSRPAVPALLSGFEAGRILKRTLRAPEEVLIESNARPAFARTFHLFWRSALAVWW